MDFFSSSYTPPTPRTTTPTSNKSHQKTVLSNLIDPSNCQQSTMWLRPPWSQPVATSGQWHSCRQKTALQGPQLSTTAHDGSRAPSWSQPALKAFIYVSSSLIGDFGHPVGRHGEGREWGNMLVTVHPSGAVVTFLGGGSSPLEKDDVGWLSSSSSAFL